MTEVQFQAVLETVAGFGCDSGVPGDPKLPDGWHYVRPVVDRIPNLLSKAACKIRCRAVSFFMKIFGAHVFALPALVYLGYEGHGWGTT